MELPFKQLEFSLASIFGVNDEGEGAFRGRIQHLQRAKVPSGVNTGKGRAAVYGWSQVVELVMVLDLIDIGLSPDAARRVISQNLDRLLRFAGTFAADVSPERFGTWIEGERCPLEEARVIAASAGVLHALSGGEDIMFDCLSGREFAASIADEHSYQPASCFLNVSKRLLTLMNYLHRSLPGPDGSSMGLAAMIADFREWAASVSERRY